MHRRHKKRASIQQMHLLNALLNALLICILCYFVGYYSFALERISLLQESRLSHLNVLNYYEDKNDGLWRIYMPVVSDSELGDAFADFSLECNGNLSLSTRMNLSDAFEQMLLTDSDIVGFVLHSNEVDGVDYMYDRFSRTLKPQDESSPFYNCFAESAAGRIVTGRRYVSFPQNPNLAVYGISGLFPGTDSQAGCILTLYQADLFMSVYREQQGQVRSEVLLVSASGEIIFDSTSQHYGHSIDAAALANYSQGTIVLDGVDYYIQTDRGTRGRYVAVCLTPRADVMYLAHKNTPAIILLCLLLNLVSALLFLFAAHMTTRRVHELTQGIDRIGQSELDFRFPIYGTHDEFDQIAQRINQMAEAMQRNIEQVYLYSIREKTAEMGELQAKFNPHFLYNTLEVIRSHLQQKGDDDTASMIVLMSRVFRSALNSRHFTTLKDECLFINSYLDIYRWRYQNSFEVIYDMDTSLLECGIIRNLLQPLIENYFVHAFSPDSRHNQLIISGEPDGDAHILITVEDNGLGMSPERLHELSEKLLCRDDEVDGAGGYGLVNLNDRIRLFYGGDCGLSISSIPDHHTTIRMRIRRMSLEEHEAWNQKR